MLIARQCNLHLYITPIYDTRLLLPETEEKAVLHQAKLYTISPLSFETRYIF